jgi:hypothetical protein
MKRWLQRTGRRIPRPNTQAYVVIACTIIGIIALLGDIPQHEGFEGDDIQRFNARPVIEASVISSDEPLSPVSSLFPVISYLEVEVSLPVLPRQHATIHGRYSFEAIADRAGSYYLVVAIPEPAPFLDDLGDGPRRLVPTSEAQQRHLLTPFDQPRRVIEIPLESHGCGDEIGAEVAFTTSGANFTRRRGWARQDLHMELESPTLVSSARVRSKLVQCHAEGVRQIGDRSEKVLISLGDAQRFTPTTPQPDSYLLGNPTYSLGPISGSPITLIIATIENDPGRFWADLAIQLLLLSFGALLGGVAFRVSNGNRDQHPG